MISATELGEERAEPAAERVRTLRDLGVRERETRNVLNEFLHLSRYITELNRYAEMLGDRYG